EIENQELIERYALNTLPEGERREFEEHFFMCDLCFERLQTTERFMAGIRHAAQAGILNPQPDKLPAKNGMQSWSGWLKPAMTLLVTALVVLATFVGWLAMVTIPQMRAELATERSSRERIEREKQQELNSLNEQLVSERLKRKM